jgi:acyl carrier protein
MSIVEKKTTEIIAKQLVVDISKVTPEARFVEDLGADSLDTVELLLAFDAEFKLDISDEDAQKMLRVKDAIAYITEKTAVKL